MKFENSLAFARKLDKQDSLRSFRQQFHLPKIKGKTAIYFTGNSLGLQPKSAKASVNQELEDWATLGVEGHVNARRPWLYYHKFSKKALARLVGAKASEVVSMNQLTVNLHLMMASFYRPTKTRYKILTEAGAFSSDQYAFESQLRFHHINPAEGLIELKPRAGEFTLRTEDIIKAIEDHKEELALVIFGAVQYYSGQFFNTKEVAAAARKAGANVGFDLAHAIGNVPLKLHDDGADFAVWCSYKYLNSGPGGIAGAFVHEKHAVDFSLPRLSGWWGHDEKARFKMTKGFIPMEGVDGWQLSNFPILSGAAHLASMEIFEKAGIKRLRTKSILLTGYLEYLLKSIPSYSDYFTIITPGISAERGCQLSLLTKKNGKRVFNRLTKAGVIADWREPDVIRIAPVPLYNSFEDVFVFYEFFKREMK
ncbi:MAG: kynureninase [Cyclobacteriaceae bacterium]